MNPLQPLQAAMKRFKTWRIGWHRTVGTLLLLPTGTIYRGTLKQYSFVRVRMDYTISIAEKRRYAKKTVLSGSSLHIPHCQG
jgi:hypothetical protein